MDATIVQPAPLKHLKPHPKPAGRVLARMLAEDLRQELGIFPKMTQTYGIGGFRDTDLG
jgi:hypothetical protein